ncbi:MAG: putative heme-binding domain-containing protein [Verrucomicrobiales bacterium]|jgi:putative heme-binding domain-containing protein
MVSKNHLALFAAAVLLIPAAAGAQTAEPHWIWTANPEDRVAHLRFEFDAPADLTRAVVSATGDDGYELHINGKRVGRGATDSTWEKIDMEIVTDSVRKGAKNVVTARAKNNQGSAGFIGLIELKSAAETVILVTDENWQASAKAAQGWMNPGFNADWAAATKLNAAGTPPREIITAAALANTNFREPQATQVGQIRLPEGFKAELLYSVPKDVQGSWVAMTIDGKGRLYVSDQYGLLYRVTPPPSGQTLAQGEIEKGPVDLGGAHGLLWAHDSLYAVLNTGEHGGRGLYRVTDTNSDDVLDKVEMLKKFEEQGGEHGPHAVVLGPDGESLYIVCGNQTALPENYNVSRVPEAWGEDTLLPRVYGRGFMKGAEAPRGWIAKTDKDGQTWEIVCTGFRNEYDAGFNRHGELFSFDADMEWDLNTPWYRPTRVNHVISGAEFGWRNGSAKFPEYYSDSFGKVVNIGPGSPTGVVFGYGAKFPAKYQEAFFICDWSYGKMYAVHLKPDGASYTGEVEEFMAAQPLPLTDLVISPIDGAMYVAIGGRRVQSGLYRVSYEGSDSTEPAPLSADGEEARELRRTLEVFHGIQDEKAVTTAWPHLSSQDRAIRYAARTAIEHQPVNSWQARVPGEKDPQAALAALIALARLGEDQQMVIVEALVRFDYAKLTHQQKLDLLRAYKLAFVRQAEIPIAKAVALEQLGRLFPGQTSEENIELSELLAYLGDPEATRKIVEQLDEAPTQEEQIALAKNIRLSKVGWTPELRERYFEWFVRAQTYRGGASFSNFIEEIKKDAVAQLTPAEVAALKPIIEKKAESKGPQFTAKPREFVKQWTVDDFVSVINVGLEGNRDFTNGRNVFGTVGCFACHRFGQEGGAIGPGLTSAGGKFSPNDLLESIIEPSKEISDQYGQMIFTMEDGSMVIGRVMNLNGDKIMVNTDMYNPSGTTNVDRKKLKDAKPSPISMMPPGLINTLEEQDVLDLLAYLISGGDPDDPMFK